MVIVTMVNVTIVTNYHGNKMNRWHGNGYHGECYHNNKMKCCYGDGYHDECTIATIYIAIATITNHYENSHTHAVCVVLLH